MKQKFISAPWARKLVAVLTLVSVSAMGGAYDLAPSTNFWGDNNFQWQEIAGVTPPANVVNVQSKNGFDCLYITFADAAFNRSYIEGGEVFTDAGAQAWLKLSSYTSQYTDVLFYKSESTTEVKWGLRIYNPNGTTASSCEGNNVPVVSSVTAATNITYNSAQVTITASDDEGDDITYVVKNGNTQLGSSSTSTITITGLTSGTTYNSLKVYAVDACGTSEDNANNTIASFSTLVRPSECEGDLGHFATFETKRIHYKIEYLASTNKIRYEVRGYDTQVLDFCQIQTTEGNSDNLTIVDGVAVWKQDAPAAGTEMGILFLYSTDAIAGNEMNAQNTSSFTGWNEHLVYYKSRDCEVDPEPASAPTTTPDESTIFNDCQIYSILGSDYYMSSGFNNETWAWNGGTATTETIDGREVLHVAGTNYIGRGFNAHDISGFTHMHFDVWTQEALNLGMKLLAYDNGFKECDKQNFTSKKGSWKSIDLPLSGFNHTHLNQIYGIYPVDLQQQDVYFTNIYFYKTTDDVSCYETLNLAEGKPCEAGYEDGNGAETAAAANDGLDGDDGHGWVTWNNRPAAEEWWYVDLKNNYDISKIEILWGTDYSTEYILQTRTEAPTTADKANDASWVTIATVTDAAANSTKTNTFTSASGRYVRFHSITRSSAGCIRMREFRVFGTGYAITDENDPEITTAEVADDSENYTSVKLHLVATDEEDGTVKTFLLNKGDDNWLPITTDASDCYTVSDLSRGHYSYEVKARDHAGRISAISTINFDILNPADNLALNQPVVAGYTNPNNDGEVPAKANDGNFGTPWTTYNDQPMDVQWWSVDLGEVYQLSNVDLFWDVRSDHYLIQVAHSEPADRYDDTQWYTALEVNETQTTGNTEDKKNRYAVDATARYIRFKAVTKEGTFLKLWEFRAFGSAFASKDTHVPEITEASVSYDEGNAYLTLLATDAEDGIIKLFRVVNTTTGEKQLLTANGDNQIVLEGLSINTLYEYEIQAMDKAANLSAVSSLSVRIPATAGNIALDKPVVAGFETGGTAEAKEKVNDGNASTYWATWNTGDVTKEWIYIDLEGLYDLKRIVVKWSDALVSSDYILQSRREEPNASEAADDAAWTDLAEVTTATANSTVSTDVSGVARYIRFRTKTANLRVCEIEVYTNGAIVALDDSRNDNTSIISANADAQVNATLSRTFPDAGEWYTLCLPFDLNNDQLEGVFGSNYSLAEMTGSEDRGSLIRLNFDYVHSLAAGKPYLIMPSVPVTSAPTFNGVTIKNVDPSVTPQKVESQYMNFQGIYNATTLSGDNIRFLGDDNYLYSPYSGGTPIGAFRCYFTIPTSSPAPGRIARVFVGETVVTDLDAVDGDATGNATKYLRDGQLYIIRDGRTFNAQGVPVK